MSDVKKLVIGIIVGAIGLGMLLSSGGIWPFLGGILGLVGAGTIVFVLTRGQL